jgi:hypothetical protein
VFVLHRTGTSSVLIFPYNQGMADKDTAPARNPAAIQVDVLLEAQRAVGKRLTGLEEALEVARTAQERCRHDVQQLLTALYVELDTLNAVVLRIPVPRRCTTCFGVVSDALSSCPSCLQVL